MAKQHISQGLKTFIREKIQTVLRLEVLLLLHQQQSRSFCVVEVANELNLERDAARDQLNALEGVGVVIRSNTDKYKYHPLNASLRSMVEQLAAGYSRQRVPILSAMLTKQPDRTRNFTEAFRIIRRND